jgi:hypothetical protein
MVLTMISNGRRRHGLRLHGGRRLGERPTLVKRSLRSPPSAALTSSSQLVGRDLHTPKARIKMSEPIMPGACLPPGVPRRPLKSRVNRHAHELSLVCFHMMVDEIWREIKAGRLQADLLELYTPDLIANLPGQNQVARSKTGR